MRTAVSIAGYLKVLAILSREGTKDTQKFTLLTAIPRRHRLASQTNREQQVRIASSTQKQYDPRKHTNIEKTLK